MRSPQRPLFNAFYVLSVIVFAASAVFYIQGFVSLKGEKEKVRMAEKRVNDAPQEKTAQFPLDINEAAPEELERIRGIGPVLARRIVSFRQKEGGFRSLEELKKVRGIGPVTYKEIKPYLVLKSGER